MRGEWDFLCDALISSFILSSLKQEVPYTAITMIQEEFMYILMKSIWKIMFLLLVSGVLTALDPLILVGMRAIVFDGPPDGTATIKGPGLIT